MPLSWQVGSLLVVFAGTLIGAVTIREVNFKDFDYPWDAPPIAVPAAWKWLPGKPKSSIHVNAGRHIFISSEPFAGGYLMFRSATYGDLNGDGQDEVAVDLLCSSGGTANWHYLYVFTQANGSPKLEARLQSGSRADGGLIRVAIEQKTLVLDFADAGRRVGDCCSEGYIRVRYRWQSGSFVEVGNRTYGNLDVSR